jgi:hypothetical protein
MAEISAVPTVTRPRAGQQMNLIFLSSRASRPVLRNTRFTGTLSLEVKQQGRETDYLPSNVPKFKNKRNNTFILSCVFVACTATTSPWHLSVNVYSN